MTLSAASFVPLGRRRWLAAFALALLTPSDAVRAQTTGTTPDGFNYVDNAGNVTITGYGGAGGVIVIPSAVGTDPVVEIGQNALSGISNLTGVTVPSSVSVIAQGAFDDDGNLASVTISNGVATLGDGAFEYCSALSSISLPSSITTIQSEVFLGCDELTSINVDPSNVSYSSINGVLFDKAQDQLIAYPEGLVGRYTIPDGVTSIGVDSFEYCRHLTAVTIPASVADILEGAFVGCSALKSVIFLGNAPSADYSEFEQDYSAVVIYPVGGTGFTNPFVGLPAGPMTAPFFLSQPVNQSVDQGGSVSFATVASGEPLLSYQWFHNGSPIAGATYAILTLSNVHSLQPALVRSN